MPKSIKKGIIDALTKCIIPFASIHNLSTLYVLGYKTTVPTHYKFMYTFNIFTKCTLVFPVFWYIGISDIQTIHKYSINGVMMYLLDWNICCDVKFSDNIPLTTKCMLIWIGCNLPWVLDITPYYKKNCSHYFQKHVSLFYDHIIGTIVE